MHESTPKTIVVLPGDGIGPEVTAVAIDVLRAVEARFGHRFSVEHHSIGATAIRETGEALPPATLDAALAADAVLLGAVGSPEFDHLPSNQRPESGLLRLRKAMKTYANLRPVRTYPALADHSPVRDGDGADMLIVRELTGGLYFGEPRYRRRDETGERVAANTLIYSESEIARIAHVAFRAARDRRKKVLSVDKANVLETSQLWREVVTEIAAEYPDVELRHMYVDACAMEIVRVPRMFDVILTENLFGDILSDEASVLAGSLGLLPSASIGDGGGLYEPVHGSAPDIAGQDKANPIGAVLSAAMLLRHSLGLDTEARAVEDAVATVLAGGARTADLAGTGPAVGTRDIGAIIRDRIAGGNSAAGANG